MEQRYQRGLSSDEPAEARGRDRGVVRVTLFRIRAQLHEGIAGILEFAAY